MSSFDELHGLKDGVAKLEAEIEGLSRTLRLTQATNPGSHAASKIVVEIQRAEAIRRGMLHELGLQESAFWCGFENRFLALAREEQGRTDVITNGKPLGAMKVARIGCSYRKHPEVLERGKPEQGFFCLLETPPHGVWGEYDGCRSENFRERLRVCVAEAGRALPDYPKGADPEDFWLHRLYLDLLKNNSELLFAASEEGGMILSVCVASATFCARLERQAIQQSEPGNRAEADRIKTEGIQAEPPRAQNSDKAAQSIESKPTGRPRKDTERDLVRALKANGESWKGIAAKVNAQTGQEKSPEAYRSLLKSRSGAGKNGQK